MRGFFVFVVIAVGIVTALIGMSVNRKKRERRLAMLNELAQHFSGQVLAGSWTKQPELQLIHQGHLIRLVFYSTGGKHPTYYTRLLCDLGAAGDAFRVHLYPEKFFSRIGKALGSQDIQIAAPDFDTAFMIKGSDENRVKAFLNPETRQAIFGIRALVMNDHIDIRAKGSELRIQKLSWLEAFDLLQTYIEQGLQVFDAYLEAAAQNLNQAAFAAAREKTVQGFRCAVCADTIDGSNHLCPACGADHHPECFKLNDGCGRCGAGG